MYTIFNYITNDEIVYWLYTEKITLNFRIIFLLRRFIIKWWDFYLKNYERNISIDYRLKKKNNIHNYFQI